MAQSLYARAATTSTRAGTLGSNFTSSRSMAATFHIRAARFGPGMRAAHGAAGRLVFEARKRILQETIYDRRQVYPAPPERILTGRLKNSERIIMAGNVIRFDNTAPYAHLRHEMSGTSKLYGHQLDSFWASRAMQYTGTARAAIYRGAMSANMRLKA